MYRYRELAYAMYTSSIYSNLNKFDRSSVERTAKHILRLYGKFLPTEPNAHILDCGCGTGGFLYALRLAGYTDATGIDLSEEQLAVARGFGLDVILADVFAFLEKEEDKYDAIIATDILEHLTKDECIDYLTMVAKALKPGGKLICAMPNANSPFAARLRYKDITHEQSFTEESLKQLFLVAGLSPIAISGERIRPFTLLGWLRAVISWGFHSLWRVAMICDMGREAVGVPLDFKLIGIATK